MNIVTIIFTLVFTCIVSYSQFTNFRLHPSNSNQIEPSIVKHPGNPQILFASAYTYYLSFRSEGVYVSTNGGLTWTGTDTCTAPNYQTQHGGDPGPIIDKNGTFIITHQGGVVLGMYSTYSTNMGSTWSNNYQIAGNDQDKGAPTTDGVPTSAYYGRTYLAWTRYSTPFPIVYSHTTNSGVSWIPFVQVNNNPGRLSQGPYMSVGNNGEVYICWAASDQSSPFTERAIGFAVSTNGGATWSVQEAAFNITGIKSSSLPPWNIRVNSFPTMDVDKSGGSRNGWIYIATAEKNQSPAGNDADIVLFRSTNSGATWSSGVRVNQDAFNNGRVQYFPSVCVDESGGVNVLYFDNRNSADSAETFISRSTNGGDNWTDYKVSSSKFRPNAVTSGGNQGDNIGMTSTLGKLIPVWMDNRTSVYQIWSALIDINTIGIQTISNETPKSYSLEQNYPNPFNPSTKIKFSILNNNSQTSLIIYDMNGREVTKLVDGSLNAGTYEAEFNSEDLSTGVYYYKLVTGGFTSTKKMVLLK